MTTSQFLTLAEAESFLRSRGFRLIQDTCDWTNAAGDDAGVFPIYSRYGQVTGWRVEINPAASSRLRNPDDFAAALMRSLL